ncbi:hypothetical protein [Pseudobacillus badius]|uniref:hypothetical protein n=1 Tax=Bacillus badius TaxID=1455 RepID=UPI0007B3675B|nr:hypothetical protein [Bacillus badius]KZR57535.1 hypothetical protein A3781_19785 [Bacillus badius]
MNFEKLFTLVDTLIGDISTFEGLAFTLDNGVLVVDYYETGFEDDFMFICDFIYNDESTEPVSFAAKGIQELKEQFEYYVLQ